MYSSGVSRASTPPIRRSPTLIREPASEMAEEVDARAVPLAGEERTAGQRALARHHDARCQHRVAVRYRRRRRVPSNVRPLRRRRRELRRHRADVRQRRIGAGGRSPHRVRPGSLRRVDQVLQQHRCPGRRERLGQPPQEPRPVARVEPPPPRHRSHRPLLGPRARLHDTARRTDPRARRPGATGQGSLRGSVELPRVAGRTRQHAGGVAWLVAVRGDDDRVLVARAHPGA